MGNKTERKLVKISELSIYGNPSDEVEYVVIEKPYSFLERSVSTLQKSISQSLTTVETSSAQIKTVYDTGVAHAKSTYEFLTNEENSVPRAVTVTVGGLCGLLMGARGGVIKKIFYTSSGLLITSSICYPKQAVDISKKSWDYIRTQGFSAIKDASGYDLNEIFKPIEVKVKEAKIPSIFKTFLPQESLKSEDGDLGQGNPKDDDMYTTRT